MLTVKQLSFRIRSGRIYPQLLSAAAGEDRARAERVLEVFRGASGLRVGELDQRIEWRLPRRDAVSDGLIKLVMDKCEFVDPPVELAEARFETIMAAQEVRAQAVFDNFEGYRSAVSDILGESPEKLSAELYGDLPTERVLKTIPDFTPEWLIARYNCAQYQGLILHAQSLCLDVKSSDMAAMRGFFRAIKFHQLLVRCEPSTQKGAYRFTIDGPAAIFSQASRYGAKLANLFPHIVNLSDWKLEATVKIKGKSLDLKVDSKAGLKSYISSQRAYVPQEFAALAEKLSARLPKHSVSFGASFLNIGDGAYVFPDFEISREGETKPTYIELFHKWHAGQLVQRMQAWSQHPEINIIFGISRDLMRGDEVKAVIDRTSNCVDPKWFVFREFPTTSAVLEALGRPELNG